MATTAVVRGGLPSTSGFLLSFDDASLSSGRQFGQGSVDAARGRIDRTDRPVISDYCTSPACPSSSTGLVRARCRNVGEGLAWGQASSTGTSAGTAKGVFPEESRLRRRKEVQGARLDSSGFLSGTRTTERGVSLPPRSSPPLQMVLEAPPKVHKEVAAPLHWHAADLQGRIDTLSNESRFDFLHRNSALGVLPGPGSEKGVAVERWLAGGREPQSKPWQDEVDALSAVAKVAELAQLAVKSAEDSSAIEAEREALEAEAEFIAAHQYEDLFTAEDYALLQKARTQDVEDYNAEMKLGLGPDPSPFRVAFEQALQMPQKKKAAIEKSAVESTAKRKGETVSKGVSVEEGVLESGVLEAGVLEREISKRVLERTLWAAKKGGVSKTRGLGLAKAGVSERTLERTVSGLQKKGISEGILETEALGSQKNGVSETKPSSRAKVIDAPARERVVKVSTRKKTVTVPVGGHRVEVPMTEAGVLSPLLKGGRLSRKERTQRWAQKGKKQRGLDQRMVGGRQPNMNIEDSALLTLEEETECTTLIREKLRLEHGAQSLATELGRAPTTDELAESYGMTTSECRNLLARGSAAKSRMVKSNLGLVVSVAKMYQGRGLELTDLIQEGNVGLMKGIEKFDTSLGYKFSTYAHWWIRQAVARAVQEHGRTIRLPNHIYEAIPRISQARQLLKAKHNREPTIEEIAALTDYAPEKVTLAMTANRKPRSADQAAGYLGGDQEPEAQDTLLSQLAESDDSEGGAALHLADAHLSRNLKAALDSLNGREQEVLSMRFGLDDGRAKPLEEIGVRFDISKERVRQILLRALRKLQDPTIFVTLSDFVKKG